MLGQRGDGLSNSLRRRHSEVLDIRDQMKAQQTVTELTAIFVNDMIPVDKKVVQTKEQLIKDVEAFLGDSRSDSSVAVQQP